MGSCDVKCEDDLDGVAKRVIAMKMEVQGIEADNPIAESVGCGDRKVGL